MQGTDLSLSELESYDHNGGTGRTWAKYLCPFCDHPSRDDSHRSLRVNTNSHKWKCWRCERFGTLMEFKPDWKPATQTIDRNPHRRKPKPVDPPKPKPTDPPKYDFEAIVKQLKPIEKGTEASWYLSEPRALPEDFHKYAMALDDIFGRGPAIAFPTRHIETGELVGLNIRTIEDNYKRTLKHPAHTDSPAVFFTDRAILTDHNYLPLVVTEAPLDALSLAVAGLFGIATVGTAFPAGLPRLCFGRTVLLAHDNDEPGDKAARRAAEQLKPYGCLVKRLRPEGKDWNFDLAGMGLDSYIQGIKSAIDDLPDPFG